jgi:hypothetical protein
MFINRGGPQWDSTVVTDGPATIRVTVVFTDGSYRQFDRVVNVQNGGKGNTYFGIDRSAITGPISGDNWGVPGWVSVPMRGVPKWVYELPFAYWACDVAAGEVKNPLEADWTMFWINDNVTTDEVRTAAGWTVGGKVVVPDWSMATSFGRSGGLCRLDTTTIPNGRYTVRLRYQLTNGTTMQDMVAVDVKN